MEFSGAKAELVGHLGLIAGMLQDTGLMDKIDEQFGLVEGGVCYGHRVGAMILNGLGFINTALYMTPRFFHDKPISLLLGADITAEQLNDDSLGRCLDKIANYGATKWYSELALHVVCKMNLLSKMAHLDSTTLSLYGNYHITAPENSPQPLHGYSKDHRSDLKQVTLQCVTLGKASLPIWMEALNGNSSDKKSFPETVKRVDKFYREVKDAPKMCFVADSALYNGELNDLNVDWLTRVPETYKEAKRLCSKQEIDWCKASDDRYCIVSYVPEDKQERWLLVRSEPAFFREKETFLRRHEKIFDELHKALWHCACQEFNCEGDAKKAIEKIIRFKKHQYDVCYEINAIPKYTMKGRPSKNQVPNSVVYQVKINGISSNLTLIKEKTDVLGRFILATNVLDKNIMSDDAMLIDYKEQGEIERGFRFIKNDTFGLDEVYLKKPSRIGALMAIMTLCLLVYGLTQYRLRTSLLEHKEVLPDQKKRPTQRPTLMWILSLFSSITMIRLSEQQENQRFVLNMHPLHQKILLLFGGNARKIYLLPDAMHFRDVKLNQKTWLQWCGI